jgi:hypothetical protein
MFPKLDVPPEKTRKTEKEIQEQKERAERINILYSEAKKSKLLEYLY